jgi:hypothetical protein
MRVPIADSYRRPLWDAFAVQAVLLMLSAMMLDFGVTAQCSLIALLAFWGGTLMVLLRRPRNPTRMDLGWIRWGYLPLLIAVQFVARSVWHWRGLY